MPTNATVDVDSRTVTFHIPVEVDEAYLREDFGSGNRFNETELYEKALEILWDAPAFDGISHSFIEENWE